MTRYIVEKQELIVEDDVLVGWEATLRVNEGGAENQRLTIDLWSVMPRKVRNLQKDFIKTIKRKVLQPDVSLDERPVRNWKWAWLRRKEQDDYTI